MSSLLPERLCSLGAGEADVLRSVALSLEESSAALPPLHLLKTHVELRTGSSSYIGLDAKPVTQT